MRVELGGSVIADSTRVLRVLETSHPPTLYIPRADVVSACFSESPRRSFCEWKGHASYLDVEAGDRREEAAAWFYPRPAPPYEALLDHVSLYPGRMDACFVHGERVEAQPGDFYGGWITEGIVGPFKGGVGSVGW